MTVSTELKEKELQVKRVQLYSKFHCYNKQTELLAFK